MFPRDGYATAPTAQKLHYLIALRQPLSSIVKLLKKVDHVDEKDPLYKLTPLAVAAMDGNADVVKILLALGANPLPLDKVNWTPLHYLEIERNGEIEQMIKTAAKTRDLPNLKELQCVLNPRFPENKEPVVLQQQPNGITRELRAEEFNRLYGMTYSHELVGTRESLAKYWLSAVRKTDPELEARFLKNRFKLPPLALKSGTHQVITTQGISSGDIVGFHGGKISPAAPGERDEKAHARMGEVDAGEITNLAAMIKDGTPNCHNEVIDVGGIPYQLFIASRPIKAGEELRIDFGPYHCDKFEYQPISRETIEFYRQNTPMKFFSMLMNTVNPSSRKIAEIELYRAQISYLISNPFLVFELLHQKLLDPQQLYDLLNEPLFQKILNLSNVQIDSFCIFLEGWMAITKVRLPNRLACRISRDIYTFIKAHPIDIVIQFMDQLKRRVPDLERQTAWGDVLAVLKKNAEAESLCTDWLKDEATDAEARLAIQSIALIDRKQFITNMRQSAAENFPTKQKPLKAIVASVAISEWAKDEDLTHLSPMMDMSTAELREIIARSRPHIGHKYPRLLAEFDRVLDGFIAIADQTYLAGQ